MHSERISHLKQSYRKICAENERYFWAFSLCAPGQRCSKRSLDCFWSLQCTGQAGAGSASSASLSTQGEPCSDPHAWTYWTFRQRSRGRADQTDHPEEASQAGLPCYWHESVALRTCVCRTAVVALYMQCCMTGPACAAGVCAEQQEAALCSFAPSAELQPCKGPRT